MQYGSAHAAGLYTVPNGSGTQFEDGCDAIWDAGLRTLKVYCASTYLTDYPLQAAWSSTPTTLTQLAQTTQFATQLAREWETVVLTCFTFANGATNWWRADVANSKLEAEYAEVKALAVHLLTTYAGTGRTFILQQWEGDWAFMDSTTVDARVEPRQVARYAAFLATRQRAVEDARAETAHEGVRVLHAIEVNRVVDAAQYPHRRRIVADIAERVRPDVVSYSAYDSTIVEQGGWGASYEAWEAATVPVFRAALRAIKRAWPGIAVYIGEFGFPENEAEFDVPDRDIGPMIQAVHDVALEEGCTHFLYWQVFDNEASIPHTYRGYWLQKPDGGESVAGAKFRAFTGTAPPN